MDNIDDLKQKVLFELERSSTDFKLTDTLATHCYVGRATMVGVLDELWRQGVIRHPVGFTPRELEWWRLVSKGYTRGEKWRMTLAVIGFYRISDGTPAGAY